MTTAIEFQHIHKAYGEKIIISDLSLTIEQGEFVTFIGSSGCGKTTLLKMVNGLTTPTSGNVLVNGEDIREKNLIELRRNIGYAIQGSVLFPHMTVEQNIAYVPNLLNKKDTKRTKDAVTKWMQIVGLDEELKDHYPAELSGGQAQRVGIARSLAASPDVLLMDEALKLGTKVLVMNAGEIQQYGTPHEIFHKPATDFVGQLVKRGVYQDLSTEND